MATELAEGVLRRAFRTAGRLLAGNRAATRVVTAAAALLDRRPARLKGVTAEVGALIRMVRETLRGRYRKLPRRALLASLAGMVYFLDPLDLVPDVIPLFGFLDDAIVLTWIVAQVRRDLDAFLVWEREWGRAIDVEGAAGDGAGDLPELPA
ncbi:MAG: YkvA family protein [Acidobacteriota bacterium]